MKTNARFSARHGVIALLVVFLLTVAASYGIGELAGANVPTVAKPVIVSDAIVTDERALAETIVAPKRVADSPEAALSARAANAAIPISTQPLVAARSFRVDWRTQGLAAERARTCLAMAVHYEAASESLAGQQAVAQVVLNRTRHPAYPNSVCDVVFQGSQRVTGCQFSFTCDGSLARRPRERSWKRALAVADAALGGFVQPLVGTATHYHTHDVVPDWRLTLDKIGSIGAHIFYRWRGRSGQRAAFVQAYGGERVIDVPPLVVLSDADVPPPSPADIIPTEITGLQADANKVEIADAPRVQADAERGTLIANEGVPVR